MATRLNDLPAGHDLGHLNLALHHVSRWDCAVDGGAHVGIWTRRLLQSFRRVIAFEPQAANAARLPSEADVRICGLGGSRDSVGLAPGPQNTGQWYVAGPGSVPVIALDEMMLPTCDFLKLDVEGYELFALQGAADTIHRCRPVVMIEENGLCTRYGVRSGAAAEFLGRCGMRHVATYNKDMLFTWSR